MEPHDELVRDAVVIGAGQAGLASSYHLRRLGIDHVVLDADAEPGGAWRHRWDSLTMTDVHGVADLPGSPAPGRTHEPANVVLPAWFARYERDHGLPVERPVRVASVADLGAGGLLEVRADRGRRWLARSLVNATGTWTRPFVPSYPGADSFLGEQVHTVDYPGTDRLAGRRVLVVGGGASAVQFLGELAPVADVIWVTRRPPVWRTEDFDREAGREAVTRVSERVLAGLPPTSVVGATGLGLRVQEGRAAELGVYASRRPMFSRITPTGVVWADGSSAPVDVIVWATGFRPSVTHLAPLRLRSDRGGIPLLPGTADVQTMVTAARDRRVQLVGYGPSASTLGAGRAGRAAALAVRRLLAADSAAA